VTLVELARLTSPAAAGLGADAVGVVAVGALEQHGPHLPLGTDTTITDAVVRGAAERVREPVVVAPTFALGVSDHHVAFPGTVTVSPEILGAIIDAQVAGFARMGVRRVALLSLHGGNFPAFAAADHSLDGVDVHAYDRFDRVLEVMAGAARQAGLDAPDCDSHAGAYETSLVLHLLGDDAVRDTGAETGLRHAPADWLARLRAHGIVDLSSDGVLGDPGLATAAAGRAILAALVAEMTSWLVAAFGLTEERLTAMTP
jgi:creatinine amidohydrolase